MFRLATNAAHKNQHAKQVVSCSYNKQTSSKPCRGIYSWNHKLQLVQALKAEDLAVRYEFLCEIIARTENHNLPSRFIFSDEATYHINSKVNRHNVCVRATENPHVTLRHERDSSNVNVFCTISKKRVYGLFLFMENTVTG
jgi:hypothetical protein